MLYNYTNSTTIPTNITQSTSSQTGLRTSTYISLASIAISCFTICFIAYTAHKRRQRHALFMAELDRSMAQIGTTSSNIQNREANRITAV